LIGLHLSAAFDTVDHEILLQLLQSEFGWTDTLLSWLSLYLEGRTQFIKLAVISCRAWTTAVCSLLQSSD